MKRKPISTRTRFEVFKRDGFKCQYCGAHPPDVILHVDHIEAVANGGTNDMDNLITSCSTCNLGKSSVPLSVVPQSLADKAAEVVEREAQIAGYTAVLTAKRERIERDVWAVFEILSPGADNVPRDEYASVQRFVERLGVEPVIDAAYIAMAAPVPVRRVFRYFCGICWNRVHESEKAK